MEIKKEAGWKLHPVGGNTGKAYMAVRDQEKVFLKRNTSPFLAALALEGVAPKLVWTKRIENGDVLTAQVWCNGRTLEASEMSEERVLALLQKVHDSRTLARVLKRVSDRYIVPTDLLDRYVYELPLDLERHETLEQTYNYLLDRLPVVNGFTDFVVSHGDVCHENYLLSEEDDLFLVDWDSAILADPAYDLGQLAARYIDKAEWRTWLTPEDAELAEQLLPRVEWYATMFTLNETKRAYLEKRFNKMNRLILELDHWLS